MVEPNHGVMTTKFAEATVPTTDRAALSARAGFWIVAIAFAVLMAFTTVPTPLYALYQARDGFPTLVVTAIFAAYAVGVILGLLFLGHAGDHLGRRPVVLAVAGVQLLTAIGFTLLSDVAGLLVLRLVSGVAAGVLTSTATAYLAELRRQWRPGSPGLAVSVGAAANLGGLALGPLVSGMVAEWAPVPMVTAYLVLATAIIAVAIPLTRVTETVEADREGFAVRPQPIAVPAQHRTLYWAAGLGIFTAFAITGFYGSVAPAFLGQVLGSHDRLLAGVASTVVFAAAAGAQLGFGHLPMRLQLRLGTAAMAVGLIVIAFAGPSASLAAFLGGGAVAGAGLGLMFRGSLAVASGLSDGHNHGAVLAGILLIGNAGLAIAPVLVGLSLNWLPIVGVTIGFAAAVLVLVLWAGPRLARAGRTV